jgi:hypothetical protein
MERRGAARKRVLKRGMVELRENALSCKIVDLSDTGAGLALSGTNHVPNFFTLLIPDRAPVFCQCIWRQSMARCPLGHLQDMSTAPQASTVTPRPFQILRSSTRYALDDRLK